VLFAESAAGEEYAGSARTVRIVPDGVQATIRVAAEVEDSAKPGCVVETLNRWLA
jgi:hypothetical protein